MHLNTRLSNFPRKLLFLLVLGVLSSAVTGQLYAQDKTWTGAIDAEWNKAGNWSPVGVPGSGANVQIQPNGGNPYPVISQADVTISSVVISNWNGGQLTVSNGKKLTITNGLTMNGGSTLSISGGMVDLTGGSFNMSYNNSLIEMSSGSFSSDIDIEIKGNGFDAGLGTVSINANFTLPSGKVFNVESATVAIANTSEINGTYNGDDGHTTFNNNVQIRSGGVVNLDTGTLIFNGDANIGNNGTLNMGSGTVELNSGLTAESDGNINVEDGSLNIQGDANFQNNGNLSVDTGSINVSGDATLQNGGSFNFNEGSLNVGGNASFTNGGTVNAGESQMDFKGDLNIPYSGTFNADSSTVVFSGDQTQTISTNGDDLTFYNVEVKSGSSVQTDGSSENTITVENNLTVEEGGQVGVQDDDNIDIQGDLNNQGDVQSEKPFVYAISTPSLTEVLVTFDKEMQQSSAENAGNYTIDNGISVSSATLNSSDPTEVTLVVSNLTENVEYTLTINNVMSTAGGEISEDHRKRFTPLVDITYYSLSSGDWDAPASWSTESHTGAPAATIPNAQDGEDVIIGNNHTITLGSTQNISNLNQLTINTTGKLVVSSGDTLILDQFPIIGDGAFELQSGGTINIGSAKGITAGNTTQGNIQVTGSRIYSSLANYIYSGSSAQQTGSGLPQTVRDLYIDNNAGVQASDNIQVDGTIYLQNGSLTIPSGQAIIANDKSIKNGSLTFERIFTGSPGWRMISSPVTSTIGDFLDGIITQGYDNAHYDASTAPNDTLQPNVMYYLESYKGTDNQRWRAPASASTSIQDTVGYNLYLFGDVSNDSRYNNPLPDTISVQGQEHEGIGGQFDLKVSYTAEADTGWNLVGNPFGAAINWDENASWTKTNIDQTIYIWEPDTKSYKTWNGTTGSLGNGIIPPFQAFWVKANGANPILKIDEDAKTFGGTFVGKVTSREYPEIEIQLIQEGHSNSIYFSFSEDAKVGKDAKDGYHLQPPPGTGSYSEIFSIGRGDNRFSINSLPIHFGIPIEIPISANVFRNHQKVTESVNLNIAKMKNLPPSWEVSLVDRKTGQKMTPTTGMNYQFKTQGAIRRTASSSKNALQKDYQILSKADPSKARFALRIDPGTAGSGLPKTIDLRQNYPNPFNPTTTIRFTLPIQNQITLEIYNILGRKVATLANKKSYQAGQHKINWDASNLASGTYIYRLVTDQKVISKKMTLIK